MHPTISVIIPTFNRELFVSETLDSVLDQSCHDWECIIVDDGSKDGTLSIVKRYVKDDKRFRLFERDRLPKGGATCRNIGIEFSLGQYILFLDSDDILGANCLESRLGLVKQNPQFECWVFDTGFLANKESYNSKNPGKNEKHLEMFLKNDIPWTIMGPIWKKQVLLKLNGFEESLPRLQDFELHLRMLSNPIEYLDLRHLEPNVFYRVDSDKYKDSSFLEKHIAAETRLIELADVYLNRRFVRFLGERVKKMVFYRAIFTAKIFNQGIELSLKAYSRKVITKQDYICLRIFIKLASIGFLYLPGFGRLWKGILRI